MIVKEYIKSFEKLGFGMFVHFGLYSVHAKGEWAFNRNITPDDYKTLFDRFNPDRNWARDLVATAKAAGCKYINITTRHHDGFSLYDTCGLTDYDAPHSAAGRDLIREFVDACNDAGIVPFFYHTLLDWHVASYRENFSEYLNYLRRSIEILCTNYGKIGGFFFDGMWDKWDADWEEDALYATIRAHQPEAMIINNTGLSKRGELGHIELDSVTFERGRPSAINREDAVKYIASEMNEVFANHWGYAKRDFQYKSLVEIIESLCVCRRYGSNFLLNVGPTGSGALRLLDRAMLTTLGEWVEIHKEALYLPRPAAVEISGNPKDFLLRGDGCYYLFIHDLPMKGDPNVANTPAANPFADSFAFEDTVKSIKWLDNGEDIVFLQEGNRLTVSPAPQIYGESMVVKVAKIELQ